jgi:hypothetical protein
MYLIGDAVPVDEAEFQSFERERGLHVPAPLRALWEVDRQGLEVTDLGIAIHGWPPTTLSEGDLPVDPKREPRQLRLVGGDLGDDVWAVWLPPLNSSAPSPVIVVRDYDEDDLVVAASGLAEFLRLETAASLLLNPPPGADAAVDALDVPSDLRDTGLGWEDLMSELMRWADPRLGSLGSYTRREGVDFDRIEGVVAELPV